MGDPNLPTIEERVMLAKQNAALLAQYFHALALAEGAGQDPSSSNQLNANAAWAAVRLSENIYRHLSALATLPYAITSLTVPVAEPDVERVP